MMRPVALACCLAAAAASLPSIPMKGLKGAMSMPLVGIGTWQYDSATAERVVKTAFDVGYRHVDTALLYKNHQGVAAALKSTGIPRGDYFVTTKIPGGLNDSATTAALDESLSELQLEYVDLMLMHFPMAVPSGKGSPALRKEQWLAMERWAKSGKARAIGVSHFCRSQLDDVLAVATVPVSLNQVEYHVGMGSAGPAATDDKEYCESRGVVYMAFSTLCGPCPAPGNSTLLKGPLVTSIGNAHNKSGAQVALKWAVQQGIPVVPKSRVPEHIKENMELFDWKLTDREMLDLTFAKEPAVAGGGDGKTSGDCSIPMDLVV